MAYAEKSAKFEWTDEAQEAFESLKRALTDVISLAFPYPDRHGRLRRCDRRCVVTERRWGRKTHLAQSITERQQREINSLKLTKQLYSVKLGS